MLPSCLVNRPLRYPNIACGSIPAGEWEFIREALQLGQLAGTKRFAGEVETIIGRRIEIRRPEIGQTAKRW